LFQGIKQKREAIKAIKEERSDLFRRMVFPEKNECQKKEKESKHADYV